MQSQWKTPPTSTSSIELLIRLVKRNFILEARKIIELDPRKSGFWGHSKFLILIDNSGRGWHCLIIWQVSNAVTEIVPIYFPFWGAFPEIMGWALNSQSVSLHLILPTGFIVVLTGILCFCYNLLLMKNHLGFEVMGWQLSPSVSALITIHLTTTIIGNKENYKIHG